MSEPVGHERDQIGAFRKQDIRRLVDQVAIKFSGGDRSTRPNDVALLHGVDLIWRQAAREQHEIVKLEIHVGRVFRVVADVALGPREILGKIAKSNSQL